MKRRACLCLGMAIIVSIVLFPIRPVKGFAKCADAGMAECVIEQNSGRILYETHGDWHLPMASTTKIVTAITALECCENLQERIKIPQEAEGVEGSSVYLKYGEEYTVEDLLYGLMLRSGNDCAVALALRFGGSLQGFSKKMNVLAQKAGALNSHFSNPHGLPCENHYTTARDLCYITRYAMKNPDFLKIVSTKYYPNYNWKNKNKMLMEYEGALGVKTGYTKAAGRCLVSAAARQNLTLICCVLNCPQMYERSTQLLDDAFQTYQYQPILLSGTKLTGDNEKRGMVLQSFYYPISEGEKEQLSISTTFFNEKKNKKIVGQFRIYLSKRLLFSGNLYKL